MPGTRAHVAILMASRDGASFIDAQIASIAAQTHRDWRLWVSDDGSRDGTLARLAGWARELGPGRMRVLRGPGGGATANFLSLLARAGTGADFAALADQDDVWFPDKIARAIARLGAVDGPGAADAPALYGARTLVTDARLAPRGLSPGFARPPGFRNALVQSLAGGNTMVLNRAGHDLVRHAAAAAAAAGAEPAGHDWWLYQLIAGAGGRVVFDRDPVLHYRQHGGNAVGSNRGIAARALRIRAALGGRYARWNAQNIAALECAARLTDAARADLDAFRALRGLSGIAAIRALRRAGFYRQTAAGTLSLWLAAALGKL